MVHLDCCKVNEGARYYGTCVRDVLFRCDDVGTWLVDGKEFLVWSRVWLEAEIHIVWAVHGAVLALLLLRLLMSWSSSYFVVDSMVV